MIGYIVVAYIVAGYGFVQSVRSRDGYALLRWGCLIVGMSLFVWTVKEFHA